MKQKLRKLTVILMVFTMVLGTLGITGISEVSAANTDTVKVTLNFDRSSIGTEEALDLYAYEKMPGIEVEIAAGETVYDAFVKAAEMHPDEIQVNDNYISGAYGLGNTPEELQAYLLDTNIGSQYCGWMFYVNGEISSKGAADYVLNDDSVIDLKYAISPKYDGGAYDWDFIDAYNKLDDTISKAGKADLGDYTDSEKKLLNDKIEAAENLKDEINNTEVSMLAGEKCNGFWAAYFNEIGLTNIWGTGSVTERLKAAGSDLEKAINKEVAPTGINLEDIGSVYVGKQKKINYQVVPECASQEVIYDVTNISGEAEVTDKGYLLGKKKGMVLIQLKSKENPDIMSAGKIVNVNELPESVNTADEIFKETTKYISANISPKYDDWMVMGLARSGNLTGDQAEAYYNNVSDYIKTLETDRPYATDYARCIIGLTAAGWDVKDVDGRNLLSYLNDMDFAVKNGINGAIYTLIAYDTHDYEIPVAEAGKVQTTREGLVNYILDKQKPDGGWNWDNNTPEADVDITAMALQALAPYYKENQNVKVACDKAVRILSNRQENDGTYVSWGAKSASSSAEVITALTALGIDPGSDARFVKNGNSLIDGLNSLAADGGGYVYGDDPAANEYSTKQGYYAMAAYYRYIDSKNALYDMTDVDIKQNPEDKDEPGEGEGSGGDTDNSDQTKPGDGTKPDDGNNKPDNGDQTGSGSSDNAHGNEDELIVTDVPTGEADTTTGVQTGDNFPIAAVTILAALALIVAVTVIATSKKKRK